MDEHGIDELDRLRARAYGPSADIIGDTAAQARLRELETAAHAPAAATAAPASDRPTPAPSAAIAPSAAAPAASATPIPPTAQAATSTPLRRVAAALRRPGRRRLGILWAASLVLIAVIAAGIAYTIARAVTPSAGHRIATVAADPGFVWPNAFGWTRKGHGFTFQGITIMSSTGGLFGDDPSAKCLVAAMTADIRQADTAVDGPVYYGCGAGDFPATVQLTVIDTMPQQLRDVAPSGSAVQFVLHGDELVVYSDAK